MTTLPGSEQDHSRSASGTRGSSPSSAEGAHRCFRLVPGALALDLYEADVAGWRAGGLLAQRGHGNDEGCYRYFVGEDGLGDDAGCQDRHGDAGCEQERSGQEQDAE